MYLFLLAAAIIIVLVVPFPFLESQRYSAYASGVQALGVLIALILAVLTLGADRHDKQVDRVLALHSEFVTGEIQAARIRLIDHLRRRGGGLYIQGATRDDLQKDPRLSAYDQEPEHTPFHDANTVLRFFERANAAIKAKTLYEPLFHELIIRHVLWWELALLPGSSPWFGRVALGELAAWGHQYEEVHGASLEYLPSWRANRERDFGRPSV
jgi:hypothetical protein